MEGKGLERQTLSRYMSGEDGLSQTNKKIDEQVKPFDHSPQNGGIHSWNSPWRGKFLPTFYNYAVDSVADSDIMEVGDLWDDAILAGKSLRTNCVAMFAVIGYPGPLSAA